MPTPTASPAGSNPPTTSYLHRQVDRLAESVLPGFVDGQPRDITNGDINAAGSNTYDVHNSRLISHYVFTRGAERFEATALHHVYTVAHIGDLLTGAGFIDPIFYGGPDGRPFEIGSNRLMVTAHRRRPSDHAAHKKFPTVPALAAAVRACRPLGRLANSLTVGQETPRSSA